MLKLRLKLDFSFRGYPGCHAFFFQNFSKILNQRIYLEYTPKNLLRSRILLPKKIFPKIFQYKIWNISLRLYNVTL